MNKIDPLHVPIRYIPKSLSKTDLAKQKRELRKSRKLYKSKKYYTRSHINTFHSKPSNHVATAKKQYKVSNLLPSKELARKTKCSQYTLKKIVNKGEGAYFSSGSRPNQTAQSWGIARLASAITGGNASIVDFHLLHDGCQPNSQALKMARRTCKNQGKNCT
jgi:hypothetical protein